jgi:hypothetical protein
MRERFSGVIGVALVLGIGTVPARAQLAYPPGYGGFGWGGWGSTVQGSIARGLGAFAAGAGVYNLSTAQANAINTDTVMRWNSAVWEAQHALNASNYARRLRRKARVNLAQARIYDRLRNHPNSSDVTNGDALNVVLDELTNPKVSSAALRTIREPLNRDLIQNIPFQYASEMATICLHDMTAEDGWPPALRTATFTPEKKALHAAIQTALKEDEEGELTPETIQKVSDALNRLHAKLDQTVPESSPDYLPALRHLKALAGLVRILHSPQVEEIIAALEKYDGTTLGDLLAFMHVFNLRFAPARSFRQKQIYQQLYTQLVDQRDALYARLGAEPPPAPEHDLSGADAENHPARKALGPAASAFFQGMDWDNLTGLPKKTPSP